MDSIPWVRCASGNVFTILANFTISAKFHNPGIPEILGIYGVRAVSQFLRCFNCERQANHRLLLGHLQSRLGHWQTLFLN